MSTWLITGATGFLGRHVLDVLDSELGAKAAPATPCSCWAVLSRGLAGTNLCQG